MSIGDLQVSAIRQRFTAFGIHLSISIIVALSLMTLLFYLWYPGALFAASGGNEGLRLVVMVDVVLGPLLTLVVYSSAKPKPALVRDLSIIAALQVAALFAGAAVLFYGRPVAVVHVFDTFYVLRQADLASVDSGNGFAGVKGGPLLFYVPADDNVVAFVASEIYGQLNQLTPRHLRVDLYQHFPPAPQDALALLHPNQPDEGCVPQNISSAFGSGTVCFDPWRQEFSRYRPGHSVSPLDGIDLQLNAKPKQEG